jgi:hypothetical protein
LFQGFGSYGIPCNFSLSHFTQVSLGGFMLGSYGWETGQVKMVRTLV